MLKIEYARHIYNPQRLIHMTGKAMEGRIQKYMRFSNFFPWLQSAKSFHNYGAKI